MKVEAEDLIIIEDEMVEQALKDSVADTDRSASLIWTYITYLYDVIIWRTYMV